MKSHAKPALEPFTWQTYGIYLDTALKSGYEFIGYGQMIDPELSNRRFVLLRHDIDYDPSLVLPICRLESDRGIRATYFFQNDSPFYSIHSPETESVIGQVIRAGHELGLHFDASHIDSDEEVVEGVESTATAFESRFGAKVSAVSFHMPTYRRINHLKLKCGRINTYSPIFFERIEYVSDSNQNWRGKDIYKIFSEAQFQCIQFLTHPIWWREKYSSIDMKIIQLAEKLKISPEDIFTPEQKALINPTK